MPGRIKKRYIILGLLVLAVPILVLVGRSILLSQIKSRLEAEIFRLRDAGYVVNYDSITVDWQKNQVDVYRLAVKKDIDTTCHLTDFISAHHIAARGMSVFALVFDRKLKFESFQVDSANLIVKDDILKGDSVKKPEREVSISVDNVKLPGLSFTFYESESCKIKTSFYGDSYVRDFRVAFYNDRATYLDVSSVRIDSMMLQLPNQFYAVAVASLTFNPKLKILDIDTIRIKPYFNKRVFAMKKGFETDRVEGVIPYVNCTGLKFFSNDSISIMAQKISVQAYLKVFRDKRYPFKKVYKPLPLEMVNALPVGVDVESIVVNKSFIEYEEFSEEGDSSGSVFFDDLYANIQNINNLDKSRKGRTHITAQARLLGQGKVQMTATYPWNTRKPHLVKGTIENLDMRLLNQMVEPAIQVRIESGHLNRATFTFRAGSSHAQGELEMNYNDLKVTTFKSDERIDRILKRKKRNGEEDIDTDKVRKASLKTFILNTFVLKRDRDKDTPQEKRSGKIDFDRDKNKAVFNYWWKSVLSGVKSAYKLDKIEDSKITQALKKKEKRGP